MFSSFCQRKTPIGTDQLLTTCERVTDNYQNKQCDVALNSAIKSKWLSSPSKELSEDGQILVRDLRDVIDKAKLLFLTKNEGELLQEFIWDAQQITGEEFQKITGPVNKESARGDADRAAEGFKTLGTLLITNGEFRKLCMFDLSFIFRGC